MPGADTIIETDRLILRRWRESDLDGLADMMGDEDHAQYIGGKKNRDESWRLMALFMGHIDLRGYGLWAMEDKATGAFAGRTGIWYPHGWPEIEVGWGLAKPFLGKGYATEAAAAAANWAFDNLGLDHLISIIHQDNSPSMAVARRLGEVYDRDFQLWDMPCHIYRLDKDKLVR